MYANAWKLTDFGISAEATSKKAHSTAGGGTYGYMAPELLGVTAHYTNKVDIWSFGCILYELACGKRAFAKMYQHDTRNWSLRMQKQYLPMDKLQNQWPNVLISHLKKFMLDELLAKDATKRPSAIAAKRTCLAYCRILSPVVAQSVNPIQYIMPRFTDWKKLARKDNDVDRMTVSILNHIQARGGKLRATWRTLVEREPQNQRFLDELAIDLQKNADNEAIEIWRTVLIATPSIQQLRHCMVSLNKNRASHFELLTNKDYITAFHAAELHLAVWHQLHTKQNRQVQDYIFPGTLWRARNAKPVRFPLRESNQPKGEG